mmetsp:Transcript_49199/g.96464  ORF Transcript_49199/g.96464 Transcript_49199/m.96464 type:complete len:320 (+) Transcript_49199:76-1035(+)
MGAGGSSEDPSNGNPSVSRKYEKSGKADSPVGGVGKKRSPPPARQKQPAGNFNPQVPRALAILRNNAKGEGRSSKDDSSDLPFERKVHRTEQEEEELAMQQLEQKARLTPAQIVAKLQKSFHPKLVLQLQQRFNHLDGKKRSGTITLDQFKREPELANHPLADRLCAMYWKEDNLSDPGLVGLQSYVKVLAPFDKQTKVSDRVQAMMDCYDYDGDGQISESDLHSVLSLCASQLSQPACRAIIQRTLSKFNHHQEAEQRANQKKIMPETLAYLTNSRPVERGRADKQRTRPRPEDVMGFSLEFCAGLLKKSPGIPNLLF